MDSFLWADCWLTNSWSAVSQQTADRLFQELFFMGFISAKAIL